MRRLVHRVFPLARVLCATRIDSQDSTTPAATKCSLCGEEAISSQAPLRFSSYQIPAPLRDHPPSHVAALKPLPLSPPAKRSSSRKPWCPRRALSFPWPSFLPFCCKYILLPRGTRLKLTLPRTASRSWRGASSPRAWVAPYSRPCPIFGKCSSSAHARAVVPTTFGAVWAPPAATGKTTSCSSWSIEDEALT